MRRFSNEGTMSILGEWKVSSAVVVHKNVVEMKEDLIRIEERSPAVNPRRACYTCIRGGVVEFSGDLDLNDAGDRVSGTFDDGARYTISAKLNVGVGGEETISGETARKSGSDGSAGQWDGKRKSP